jgi:hypothetical protein
VFEEAHRPALEKYKLVAWNQIVATSKGKNGSY